MTRDQRTKHIAQLLSYLNHLECKLEQVEQELGELIASQAVEASTKVRRDAVGEAILDQRATMTRWSDDELVETMLDGIRIDWKAAEFGSGDDLV